MVIKTGASDQKNTEYKLVDALKDFKSGFNVVILQAISVLTVVVIYYAIQYQVSTSLMLHICFCITGYGFLMTSSILLFAGENFFGRYLSRYHKAIIHGVFIGTGTVLSLAGISIEIGSRGTEWPHFSSSHAITGLVSMILMIIAFCGGIIASHVQKAKMILPCIKPLWWKIFHNFFGLSAYITGMICIGLSTGTWWVQEYFSFEVRVSMIVVTAIVVFWTSLTALSTLFDYLKNAIKN